MNDCQVRKYIDHAPKSSTEPRTQKGYGSWDDKKIASDDTWDVKRRHRRFIMCLSLVSKQSHLPKNPDTKTHYTTLESSTLLPKANTYTMKAFFLPHFREVTIFFCLRLCVHMLAWLWYTIIPMWFHLDVRNPFVFIIIIRLEEADLLGLVETAMPLCHTKKPHFTAWTFVMSSQRRTGDIKREMVPCTRNRRSISIIFRNSDWWFCLQSC